MDPHLRRSWFFVLLISPYVLVFFLLMISRPGDPVSFTMRVSGLFGFLSLSMGILMNLLKKEIKTILGFPFITAHHVLVIVGLILITLHPVILALWTSDLSVFVPETSSLSSFLTSGGRVAFILIYIGFFAAIFRSALKGRWVYIHRVVYLAMILGIAHANLIGQDLMSPMIFILYNGIAAGVVITGIIQVRHRRRVASRY